MRDLDQFADERRACSIGEVHDLVALGAAGDRCSRRLARPFDEHASGVVPTSVAEVRAAAALRRARRARARRRSSTLFGHVVRQLRAGV